MLEHMSETPRRTAKVRAMSWIRRAWRYVVDRPLA
jgi:hypothetical protein